MTKLKDESFEDLHGRKHRQYVVRSLAPDQGFGILDRYTHTFVYGPYDTWESAHADLWRITTEELDNHRTRLNKWLEESRERLC